MTGLSHLNAKGEAAMVDVGAKPVTERTACAEGFVVFSEHAFATVTGADNPKGDIFAAARIAGIMAAKRTSDLIPLCHQVALTKVAVTFDILAERHTIRVEAMARASGQTGVEMEALTAVSVACLTLYDMTKAVDKSIRIESIRLLSKTGGRTGDYNAGSTTKAPAC
jgi:cyclic pyranopterin phosphate synthase